MARPRKHIRIGGRVVDGVSDQKATNRDYISDARGKQVYFRAREKAGEAYAVRHPAFDKPEFFGGGSWCTGSK